MTAELLAAIQAAPADDAPRLVYADWLLERGDRRGDLIIAQCTRHRCEEAGDYTSDRYRSARVTESVAMRDVRTAWLAVIGGEDMVNIAFRRGFPLAVGGRSEQLLAGWSAIAALPLEMLVFLQHRACVTLGDLRRWAVLPPIPTLTTLSLTMLGATAHLDSAGVRDALAHVDAPDHVPIFAEDTLAPIAPFDECTTVLAHGETTAIVVFDAHAPLPSSIRVLSACCNNVIEHPLFRNIRSHVKRLEHLELTDADDAHVFAALDDWPHQHVHTLRLDAESGAFSLEVARRFAVSGAAKMLRHLEAPFPLDDLVAAALADAPLETLRLSAGGDTSALERALHRQHLRELVIRGFHGDPAALERALRGQRDLHTLTIDGFRGDAVDALVRAAPPQLASLTLRKMPTLDLTRLARWEQHLTSLTVDDCGDARPLLKAPALAAIPWLEATRHGNRVPAPLYRGDSWP